MLAGDRAEFRHVYPSHGPDDSMAASSQVRICRLAGGDVRGAVIVHEDVTDFGRTTEELRRAIARSEEAGRVKDDFLAMLSHELRTPLNSVLCWVQLLARGGLPPEEIRHGLAVIESIVRTQSRLINDLLDVSRIVAGKLVLDPVLIDPELHGGRVRAESPGLGQGATFTVELPVARTEPRHYAGTREPLIRRPKYGDDSRCPGLPVTPSESCGDGRPA